MFSSISAIRVSGLSKCYQIYGSPRDRLKQFIVPRLQRLFGRAPSRYFREFWALADVSLEVARGEVVGIIGRNGSVKSTLLQAICGTVTPTGGTVETKGRIAALLELGCGFNPELTGRENVYVNGAVLGLTRIQIDARYESIAQFAGIGDFIGQPVKTYSSGMFMRLAFAVAIHVDAEILVIDEALSVGDVAFQNKCIEALNRLVAKGVTVLLVTHDLTTLQRFCTKAIWMDAGRVRASGDPIRVAQDYHAEMTGQDAQEGAAPKAGPVQETTGKGAFEVLAIVGDSGQPFAVGDRLRIRFAFRADLDLAPMVFGLSVYRADGDWLVSQSSRDAGVVWPALPAGSVNAGSIDLVPLSLAPGEYRVAIAVYCEDYSVCYGMTGLDLSFSVRSPVPVWGKFLHPCHWTVGES